MGSYEFSGRRHRPGIGALFYRLRQPEKQG